MPNISVIYDGSLQQDSVNVSQSFTKGRFIYVTSSSISSSQILEIGVSCIVAVPAIGGNVEVNWTDLGVISTDSVIPIPTEIGEFDYPCSLAFAVSSSLSGFRAYVITSEGGHERTLEELQSISAKVDSLQNTANQIALTDTLQNIALSILGTGLAPISAGVTASIPALLAPSVIPLLPG